MTANRTCADPPAVVAARPRAGRAAALAAVLAIAVLAAFAPVVRNGFINFDDDVNLVGNRWVQRGFTPETVRRAFTTTETENWHPLTWLSHMLDFRLFGTWAGGHHAVSAGLHATSTALLFALLFSMTGAFWRSALVAAVFGLHPLRVESVAWAAERKDVLSLLFGLLATGAYLRHVRRRSRGDYGAALALYACALMSKAMLVTLPALLLLLDFWPLGRWGCTGARRRPATRLLLEKLPFAALAAAITVLTYRSQDIGGAVGYEFQFPLPGRLGNAVLSYGAYLVKTVWPARLAVLYPYAWQSVPRWQPFASAALLVAASLAAFGRPRRRPWFSVGWAWYLGSLLPVIGIVQIGSQSMADRYTYLPQIGVLLIVAWGLPDRIAARPPARTLALVALPVALAVLGAATGLQAARWRSSETLFSHTVRVTENNYIAMSNLGSALTEAGREAEGAAMIAKVLKHSPELRAAPYERGGDFYVKNGMPREAAEMYREALNLVPYKKSIRRKLRNLGNLDAAPGTSTQTASPPLGPGHPAPAPAPAPQPEPDPADPLTRGNLRMRSGRYQEAVSSFQEALRANTVNPSAWHNLGCAYAELGLLNEAVVAFEETLLLKPEHQAARENLRRVRERRDAEAARH